MIFYKAPMGSTTFLLAVSREEMLVRKGTVKI